MIDVEIVGGPMDGAHIALPDGSNQLRIPVLMNAADWLREQSEPAALADIRSVDMDIVKMPWGSYVYWREPC